MSIIFKLLKRFLNLDTLERIFPAFRRARETIEETAATAGVVAYQLEDLKPNIEHLEKNVEALKKNIDLFKESLKRHGFLKEEEEKKD